VANARGIFRFLRWAEPAIALNRLHHDEAPFILMNVMEIQRPQAKRTEYVGRLKDGKTRGFDLLILATPYRGRAIPFHCISYSSRTISQESSSRNLEYRRVLREALPMLRDVLETHRLEMEEGCLADNLEGWVQSDHPGFDPLAYGFQEFAEFLNFAQDKILVRVEPDEEKGLLVYLGAEFYPPAVPERPSEEAVEVEEPQPIVKGQPSMIPEPEPKPRRRTRRKPAGEKPATDVKPRRRRAPTRSRIPNPAV